MAVSSVKLNNGRDFPVIGLGTYKAIGNSVLTAVQDAIDAGYRHFDCASFYNNERQVGEGIRTKIKEGVVKREHLFIVSKVWNNSHSENGVVTACKKSLEKFGLDYLDLYLIHWPFGYKEGNELLPMDSEGKVLFSDIDFTETWAGMEKCVELGLTKSIGLSNFNSEQIDRILSIAKIKPVVNQVECNPNINQKKLIQFCKDREIVITAYCPLGKAAEVKDKPGVPKPSMDEPKIIEIGTKYKKTPAQVVLRYLIQSGVVPIPKSVTKSRIIENINIFDFKLNESEMEFIDSLNKNQRLALMTDAKSHKDYPFNIEF